MRPRRAGLLAPRPRRPGPATLGFSGAAGLPGSSSRDGGLEELPEFRDSRCSNRASLSASASLASINSASCPAISAICRSCTASRSAWRATTTSSSSRDISSGADTRRSNRSPADHPVIDTPSFREALKIKAMGAPGTSGECLHTTTVTGLYGTR